MSDDDLIERTLFHLAACADVESLRDACGLEMLAGPKDSSWADLVAAIMEGLERGWIEHAEFMRVDGHTEVKWCATSSGDRALGAFLRRHQKEQGK